MKKRNKLTTIAIFMVLLFMLSLALASAYDYDFYSNTGVATEDIAEIMDETLARHKKEYSQDPSTVYYSIDSYDLKKSSIYETCEYFLLTKYNESRDIDKVLNGKVYIQVLCTTRSGEWAYYFVEKLFNGALFENGALNGTGVKVADSDGSGLQFISIEEVEKLVDKYFTEEPQEVRLLYSEHYYLSMIYILADGKQYIIPRYNMEDFLYGELESDTLYEMDYFFEEMNRVFKEESFNGEPLYAGIYFQEEYQEELYEKEYGVPYNPNENKSDEYLKKSDIVYFVVSVVVVAIMMVTDIVIMNKKK